MYWGSEAFGKGWPARAKSLMKLERSDSSYKTRAPLWSVNYAVCLLGNPAANGMGKSFVGHEESTGWHVFDAEAPARKVMRRW
jgi:hypothetical protein